MSRGKGVAGGALLTRRGVYVAALTTIGERPTRDTEGAVSRGKGVAGGRC